MMKGIISILFLMLTATCVHPEASLDKIIIRCKAQCKRFDKTEKQYVDNHTLTEEEPRLTGPQSEELEAIVYKIEKRQRIFECFFDHKDGFTKEDFERNRLYQAATRKCKSAQTQPDCNPTYPYRTFDGTCNNLANPKYGSMFNCLKRLTDQNYVGAAGFRQSVCGGPLPEPRYLSVTVDEDVDVPQRDVTQMDIFFGQFLAHDITDVPNSAIGVKPIACCSKGKLHPQCAPIYIPKDDHVYSQHNITCFNFNRASMCDTCSIGKRNQMNQQTSYIDLSQTYGVTDSVFNDLRAKDGTGKLRVQKINGKCELMPRENENAYFFKSGDHRINQHATLMSLHTLFLREHNRIAEELHCLNPEWDDERLFQEARKINIAQYQAIVYGMHLPALLAPDVIYRYDLHLSCGQSRTTYNSCIDASMIAEFSTGAYRLHSAVNGIIANYEGGEDIMWLRNTSTNPMPLYEGKMSPLMKGACSAPRQKYDRFVSEDMTEYLYKRVPGIYGFDIVSLNIQRGRDDGLPTYTEIVYHLSNGKININCFDDLDVFMDKKNIDILREKYCDVKDIDLWIGLVNERVQEGSIVGPTAAEIIAIQFNYLKFGDRFYFEHNGNFDDRQLQTIKKASLAGILCSNTKIEMIQLNAHKFPCQDNPVLCCEEIPRIDLSFWKEEKEDC